MKLYESSLSTSFPSTDQKSEVESGTGEQARIVIRERAVNGEGITIVGAEIVIGIMIVINGMIESMREGEMGHTPMIQGATGGHAHGQGNDPGTMFATGMPCSMHIYQFLLVHEHHHYCFYMPLCACKL